MDKVRVRSQKIISCSPSKGFDFWIFECNNTTEPITLFNSWLKPNNNPSFGSNVTQEGDIYYNYTVAYWNGPFYSQIIAYYGKYFIMFQTFPFTYYTLSKSTMLSLLNTQVDLLNQSNPCY